MFHFVCYEETRKVAGKTYVVSCRVQALSPKAIVDVMSHIHPVLLQSMGVTKRRGSRQVEPSRSYSRKPPYAHVQATNASAPHQRMPTTPHELQTAQHAYTHTRAKNGNPPTRELHMHQTSTPRMHHSTALTTKVAPKDKDSSTPTAANAGISPPSSHGTKVQAPGQLQSM